MPEPRRSADMLVDRIAGSKDLQKELTNDPVVVLRKVAEEVTKDLLPPALVVDPWIYRIVVIALGIVAILAIVGAIILSARFPAGTSIQIPDVLTALGAAAIGALAGLLAPSPSAK
jgi:hypothetical protein